jgi:predicted O-methyltransferase YrrM
MQSLLETVIDELEVVVRETNNAFWNIPPATAALLQWLIKVHKPLRVLEIGTSNGYSALRMAQALSHTGGVLYTVESHAQRFEMAKANFEKAGVGEIVRQLKGHAPEILSSVEGTFDMAFLDATKMEYQSYVDFLYPKLSAGAIVIADNCVSHGDDVHMQKFLAFMKETPLFSSVLLSFDNGVLLAHKS